MTWLEPNALQQSERHNGVATGVDSVAGAPVLKVSQGNGFTCCHHRGSGSVDMTSDADNKTVCHRDVEDVSISNGHRKPPLKARRFNSHRMRSV